MESPKTTKQVFVTEYHGKGFEIKEIDLPEIKENEVIIKAHYNPLIHYDIMKMSGITGAVLPYTPCVELSGIIEHAQNKELIGKKVSYMTLKEGTLKSRIIAKLDEVLILNDQADLIKGCIMSCNPFTSLGIVDMAIDLKCKGFAMTTGNSNVGIIVNKIAEHKGLKCISIVRSEERVEEMKKIGQKYVINSSSENFVQNLNKLMIELECSVIFDALSGPIAGKLLKALPKYGTLVNFGTQTHEQMSGIDATDFRWGFKEMKTFLVGAWIDKKIAEKSFHTYKQYINDHMDFFESENGEIFKVDKLKEAVEYAEQKKDLLKVIIDMTNL